MAKEAFVLFTFPVTSPVPEVVAEGPILSVKGPISRQPWVGEALALLKSKIPFTLRSPVAIFGFVPAPLMVRLLYEIPLIAWENVAA